MSKLQIARTEAAHNAVTLQVARVEATVPAVTTQRKLQISRLEAGMGAPSTVPVITTAVVSAASVKPFDTVTMTLTITGTYNQVVWSQQATEAPPVALFGSDTAMSFEAPADEDGADVRFAVTATGPGGTSDPAFLQVLVSPQVEWFHNGTAWKPLTVATL